MAKGNDTIETKKEQLSERISALSAEAVEIKQRSETSQQEKIQAKEQYSARLDAGDENGMSGSLKKIREANRTIENANRDMKNLSAKTADLRAKHQEVLDEARAAVKPAECLAAEAEDKLSRVKTRVRQVVEMAAGINEVADSIAQFVNSDER